MGFEIARSNEGICMKQRKHALEAILDASKRSTIPMDQSSKLTMRKM